MGGGRIEAGTTIFRAAVASRASQAGAVPSAPGGSVPGGSVPGGSVPCGSVPGGTAAGSYGSGSTLASLAPAGTVTRTGPA